MHDRLLRAPTFLEIPSRPRRERSRTRDCIFVFRLTVRTLYRVHSCKLILSILRKNAHEQADGVQDRSSSNPATSMGKVLTDAGWTGLDKCFPASEATRPVNMGLPVRRFLVGSTARNDDPDWNNDEQAKTRANGAAISDDTSRSISQSLHMFRSEYSDNITLNVREGNYAPRGMENRPRRVYLIGYARYRSPMSWS